MEQTRTSFFQTSNELEHVHLMVIKLEHPIFGFERSNIELRPITISYKKLVFSSLTQTIVDPYGHMSK